jgi:hypothetical protein
MFAIINLLATFIVDLFKSRPVRAFPWNTAPTYLVRDNEGAYGASLTRVDFGRWGFASGQHHQDPPGRIHMLNASSERFGASAWIMF